MVIDDLVPCVARSLTAMAIKMGDMHVPDHSEKGFWLPALFQCIGKWCRSMNWLLLYNSNLCVSISFCKVQIYLHFLSLLNNEMAKMINMLPRIIQLTPTTGTIYIYIIYIHYSDTIMGAMASQITSLTNVYTTVYSGSDQRKHQHQNSASPGHWPSGEEFTGDRWMPRTNGQ